MIRLKFKENFAFIGVPVILAIICITSSNLILPKNCTLFVSNVPGPQMCHTIPMSDECYNSFCSDVRTESIASIIAELGILLLLVPVLIYVFRNFYNKQFKMTKFFD